MTAERQAGAMSRIPAARALAVDAYTAEVVRALRLTGVSSILLKGPAIVSLLYRDGAVRPYVDCDLLVAPADLGRAERALEQLGFEEDPLVDPRLTMHAHSWSRLADGAQVDLHRSLPAVSVGPTDVWRVLSRAPEEAKVGGQSVMVPAVAVRALIVVLHVVHHGPATQQPMDDLRRAIAQLPDRTWEKAAEVAERLNAVAAFAAGLRLTGEGEALADRLGLASPELVEAAMHPGASARIALGFQRLSSRRGAAAKLAFIWRELFPSADFIRWWWPTAARGRAALVLGYARRILWMTWHAWPSARLWRKTR